MNGLKRYGPMTVEAGTTDCRLLIDAKRSLEDVLRALAQLPDTDNMRKQVSLVHTQLETMHEHRRKGVVRHRI